MINIYVPKEGELKSREKREIFMKSWQAFEGTVTRIP